MTAALEQDLERRFSTANETIRVGESDITLLRPRNADDLISEADYVKDERLPYWAEVWPSSRILAEWFAGEAGNGRTMLELGCGLGLVTLSAMRAGFEVTATDYYDDALEFTRVNAWRATGREPATRMVDWNDLPGDLGRFDLVVACDVLYTKPYAGLIADAMVKYLATDGTAVVADPGRIAIEEWLEACKAREFRRVETIERKFPVGDKEQTIRIYRMAW
ncbi:MAG TPA: methyltransferase domain-containing protein [Gemmatimonadaceae bacterium]|nr:methyltransferase domain-containing protein [Gemmatimonadaceae bacterium]